VPHASPDDPVPGSANHADDGTELAWLRRAEAHGVPITPMAVVPAQVEADFYRWNNLPARLEALFADLDGLDPDEDDLDELLPTAAALVRGHALLDAVVDTFYDALVGLPPNVMVRRPGALGSLAARGRPALIAVKRVWAEDWRLEATLGRVTRGRGWLPTPREVLVHAADVHPDPVVSSAASDAIGRPVSAWSDREGRLARLGLA
jgi:hypothetical protein